MQILRRKVALLCAILFFCVCAMSSPAMAMARDPYVSGSGEMMAFDLVVLRPMGFVATTLGCVFFVLSLPISARSEESLHNAHQKLVVEPAHYTFVRPLGYMDSVSDRE